jgi:hypothetical protein
MYDIINKSVTRSAMHEFDARVAERGAVAQCVHSREKHAANDQPKCRGEQSTSLAKSVGGL